ncbi:MAG: hypothetical protein CL940_12010 [Deltaproteobacteria bacterium]|nr:hypothetical protein [Deltaproteobacteria bacterium]
MRFTLLISLLTLSLAACSESSGTGGTPTGDIADPEVNSDAGLQDGTQVEDASSPEVSVEVTAEDASKTDGVSSCEPGPGRAGASTEAKPWFIDISDASGIRVGNVIFDSPVPLVINDHSRLGFVDLDGDGDDDIVTHSLFPNVSGGVPFEHLIYLNQGDGTFIDHSDASGLRDIQAGQFAFGDVDNDGDQDCFAGLDFPETPGHTNQILLNDGSGVFTPLPGSGVETVPAIAANAVFADFDQDARLDLFIGLGHTSYAGPDQLLLGQGDGTFVNASDRLPGALAKPTNGSVACDYDSDGDLDILVSTYGVSHEAGHNVLWENDGAGHFTNVAEAVGFAYQITGNYFLEQTGYGMTAEGTPGGFGPVGSNGFGLDCDDIDGDGDIDVWISAISHPVASDYNRMWSDPTQLLISESSDGQTVFVNRYLELGIPFNEGDVDAGIVDFDLDGRPDLSLSRDKKYEKAYEGVDQKAWFGLMHQRADGTFESAGPDSGINDLDGVHTASLTDCTSDADCSVEGETCLFDKCRWMCTSNADCPAEHEVCHVTKKFCKPLLGMKNTQNHAWSDVDLDGDLDLLAGGRDTGGGRPNFLFRNDIGNVNPWLKLRLIGDGESVNRDAIGSRVQVTFDDGSRRTQWVKGSRGMHTSMDTRWIHVGLGDRGCSPSVQIVWSDGTIVELEAGSIPTRAHVDITYPDQVHSAP